LFVVDGSKALTRGIPAVFGEKAVIQRCRIHYVDVPAMPTRFSEALWGNGFGLRESA
jgi:hypothetical protein